MRKVAAGTVTAGRHGMVAAAALLAGALPFTAAQAQATQPGPESPDESPTIIVQGERDLEVEELRDAIRDVAMRGRNYQTPMAQYQTPLCPKVIGLGDRMSAYVSDRIRSNAVAVGVKVADAECEANALVIVTDDPPLLIEKMQKSNPQLFDRASNNRIRQAQSRGDAAIVWTRTMQQGPNGRNGGASDVAAGNALGGAFANASGPPQERLLTRASRFDIPFSIETVFTGIVVDVDRLDGAHLDQLSDFATLRILGSPQPEIAIAQEGAVSILNLFDVGPAVAPLRMTALDMAYLKGLYAMRPNDPSSRLEHYVKLAYQGTGSDAPCKPGLSCDTAPPEAASPAPQP